MTESTTKRITLAAPEDIADLLKRFNDSLQANGFSGNLLRNDLLKDYCDHLLDMLTIEPQHRGALRVQEPDA